MKSLFAALAKAQSEFKPIKKDQKGYNYKYADINSILEVIRPILSKHEIAIVQMPIFDNDRLVLQTLMAHSSGESIEFKTPILLEESKGMNKAQSFGSATSYARRYALVSCLSLEMEDDDGRGAGTYKPSISMNSPSASTISEPQKKRLFALAKNLSKTEVETILKKHGFESSKDITRDAYEKICLAVQTASEMKNASAQVANS